MTDYQTVLASFANFFGAVAQVSGALVGLVFVALTYNTRLLGDGGQPWLRALAQQVFADFLAMLMLALFMLVPGLSPLNLGCVLVLLALFGSGRIAHSIITLLAEASRRGERLLLLRRFGLSLVGNLSFLIAGWLAIRGMVQSGFWSLLVNGTVAMLISGSRSAWLLVTHPGHAD
jgi:hypothetical protein